LQAVMKRRHRGFIVRPTSTFGQFESVLSPVISQLKRYPSLFFPFKYIRIADETSFEKMHTLLFTIWRLPKPELVLTFYGSDPNSAALTKLLQRSLGKITRQTLMDAAKGFSFVIIIDSGAQDSSDMRIATFMEAKASPRTWLLTDGKLGGTADLVAQAMRGYTEAYGMKELQVIALTPWTLLANAESLRSDDFLVHTLPSFIRLISHSSTSAQPKPREC
uniref:LSDAT_prok domain-containing protein n=1 Tax=Schistocephalus solidus TaxID=70667 RepID=A0A183SE87_SCHSO